MEYVIIRPPMVYGPGAPGNFGKLVTTVLRGVPLPLGAVYNRRSLIALDNLLSFILICSDSARFPNAANQIFVVSDCEDVSTTEFVKKIAKAARRSVRLVPVPVFILKFLLSTVGMKAINDSLFGDLQIDATKARCCLKWRPVTSMDNQLAKVFEKI
jgi:nucleoside-diphosphate-sugar epimerase